MDDYHYILEIYLAMKRIHTHNPYIQWRKTPKEKDNLLKFIALMKALHADPVDYIIFAIKYYSPMRVFPSFGHLIAQKVLNKYRYEQALKNRYVYEDFNTDRDKVYIYETYEDVSYDDFNRPVNSDARLRYALFLSTQKPSKYLDTDYNDVVYAILKLTYLGKPVPEELKELKERIRKE
jgi:hypothetical protein